MEIETQITLEEAKALVQGIQCGMKFEQYGDEDQYVEFRNLLRGLPQKLHTATMNPIVQIEVAEDLRFILKLAEEIEP